MLQAQFDRLDSASATRTACQSYRVDEESQDMYLNLGMICCDDGWSSGYNGGDMLHCFIGS